MFVDAVEIKSGDLKLKINFVLEFRGFPNCLDVGKGRNPPYVS